MTTASAPSSLHSVGSEPVDLAWTHQSLSRAVQARRADYVRPKKLRVKIGTWNVAACPGTDKDLASWFGGGRGIDEGSAALDLARDAAGEHNSAKLADADAVRLAGGADIGLYVLGLQEVVDLNGTREYVNRAVYTDHGPMQKWQAALAAAVPPGYQAVVAEQMTGVLLLIYASPELAPTISNVSTKQVGTGLWGYFGNKGAVTTRLILGETTRMVFVNCHLASGASPNHLDRRCWDAGQILSKTLFDPVVDAGVAEDDGERIGDEDFAFWFGDLNFRLDGLPGDDIRRLLMLHTRGEYNVGRGAESSNPIEGQAIIVIKDSESDDDLVSLVSEQSRSRDSLDSELSLADPDDFVDDPSQDPASLQATLDSLLPHDQLRRIIKQRKAFHDGWREGPMTFLPSYKYDVGTVSLFDSSEKQRAPSWCDRILYRTRTDKRRHDAQVAQEIAVKQKDREMEEIGIDQDDDVLFSYDPASDGDEEPVDYDEYDETTPNDEHGQVVAKDRPVDRIQQEIYTSHQRITSSDHKPIISIFTLEYDAVVPELKAKVHAEVARQLDRAENEGRPGVTVVVEGSKEHDENVVDLGEIGFLDTKYAVVTIANTGGVAASLAFVGRPGSEHGASEAPFSMTTSFMRPDGDGDEEDGGGAGSSLDSRVTLEPGETVLAHIKAQVLDKEHVQALNRGEAKIEQVLVLRVEQGRDHFLPVRGSWLATCFGRSIDELIRVPDGGIRKFVRERGIKGVISNEMDVHCSAPKELFKLTEAMQMLAERCVADEAMLEDMELPKEAAWPLDATTWAAELDEDKRIRADMVAALDTDLSVLEALPVELSSVRKLELTSALLMLFLMSLTDGIVPAPLCAKLLSLSSSSSSLLSSSHLSALPHTAWADVKSKVLDLLSSAPNHNIAFVFLTTTMSRVAVELSPATAADDGLGLSALGRRINLRRGGAAKDDDKKTRLRQQKYAQILGPMVFRAKVADKAARELERSVMEMFLSKA
ncbi:hypothetical protein CDD82_1553 [Ophiocordyceps australis]|uniref:Inositol polyphosphate-related phosphatase domain-containing protein n=1 Tax=Ophiocordyceps australis TaxID=1399860 RepID=A0A2C5YRH7_9HYPO|nr:hypothetical protein CDD82_1553 [Ophiocordyceps australis]